MRYPNCVAALYGPFGGPASRTLLATPSIVSVWPGFAPALSVTESSPSDEITPVNTGGVPTSEIVRGAGPGPDCPWLTGYAIRSNLCAPIVDVTVRPHVAVVFVNVHVPGASVVLPDLE